nr:hypothetical protein GCM10020093_101440 [Planobispora longispora]
MHAEIDRPLASLSQAADDLVLSQPFGIPRLERLRIRHVGLPSPHHSTQEEAPRPVNGNAVVLSRTVIFV